jgi:diguanylate cyclase (GGDEF)-like protein
MELQVYFRILLKRWRLVLVGFLVVFLSTLFLTFRQPYIYEAQASFVIRPRSEFIVDDEFVRALDVVSRRVEINTTFAEVVGSKLIKAEAIEMLDLSEAQREGLSVSGRVIGGTNILELTVEARDPIVARDFANAVGAETVDYVASLYDVFQLEPLDSAGIPRRPTSPNPVLNLALGAVLGLALGTGLAFLTEYLKRPQRRDTYFNILDLETGAYNKSYLTHRLWQEMSRAKRNKYPLAMGLIRIDIGDMDKEDVLHEQVEALRLVRVLAEPLLRAEDVMARFDDETLALLLVDMTEEKARTFMEDLSVRVQSAPQDTADREHQLVLKATVSAVSYENRRMKQVDFVEQVVQVLEEAVIASNGRETIASSNHESEPQI